MCGILKPLKDNIGRIFLLTFYLFVLHHSGLSQCLNSTYIYYNNFNSTLGPGWSTGNLSLPPVPHDSLGPFGPETVTFKSDNIPALPCYDSARVSFRLILKGSWDGNGDHCCGPDIFIIKVNGIAVYKTTFGNTFTNHQSYPAQYYPSPNTVNNPEFTGSAHNNQVDWSTYFFSFTFPFTPGSIVIDISQPASQGIDDEAWYLDDFSLTACRSSIAPQIQVTPPLIICYGDSTTLTASGAISYSWEPSYGLSSTIGTSVRASPPNTTTYTITGNTTGCSVITSTTVTVQPKISSIINKSICQGQSYSGYSAAGIYNDTLIAANGCDSISVLNLTVNPNVQSTINKSICKGEFYLGHSITGIYIDTLFAANGCDSLQTVNLTVLDKPAPFLGADKQICSGDSLKLFPGSFASYLWQDSSTLDHFMVKHPGVYSVTVNNACGTSHDKIMVSAKRCDILFPNAFTPNKDGINDFFKIPNAYNLVDYNLLIYNRWGQKVFDTKESTQGWDGTFNGAPQDPGIYIYYCRYTKSNTIVENKGTVILIR